MNTVKRTGSLRITVITPEEVEALGLPLETTIISFEKRPARSMKGETPDSANGPTPPTADLNENPTGR